jgi:hypothetical protein
VLPEWGQLTAPGALIATWLLLGGSIARGLLTPRRTVDALLTARDGEIDRANKRADEWHAAYETERHRADLLADQNRELIEVARTVEHVMQSLDAVTRRDD